MNEVLLIITLLITYGGVVFSYILFGTKGFLIFGAFATVVANIEVNILINAFGMTQTLGNVLFASTFLITDALSEIKGKNQARQAVKTMLFFNFLFLIFSQLWLCYTPVDFALKQSFNQVFSETPRVICASLFVFAVASYLDVWLYYWWWRWSEKVFKQKEKYLWIRNNGSTLISQLVNTVLFTLCAFGGRYTWDAIEKTIFSSYLIFICLALLDTPILYLLVYLAKRKNDYDLKKNV